MSEFSTHRSIKSSFYSWFSPLNILYSLQEFQKYELLSKVFPLITLIYDSGCNCTMIQMLNPVAYRGVCIQYLAKLRDVDTPPYTPLQPPTLLNTSIYRALITPFTPKSIDLSIQAHTLIALAIHK